MAADLQMGIFYALVAGTLWGIGPLLLKRGMTLSNVSTATLIEQHVSVALLLAISALRGELFYLDFASKSFRAFVAAGTPHVPVILWSRHAVKNSPEVYHLPHPPINKLHNFVRGATCS